MGSATTNLRVSLASSLGVLLSASTLSAQMPPPCSEDPAFSALDFWVGEWTVWAEGERVGENRIAKVQGGCAIEEHWTDANGGTGQSLFYYLPASATWRQVWVTPHALAAGGVKEKERVPGPEGSVRFRGTIRRDDGTTYLDRTTLTPQPSGAVRQHIEVSMDGGETWRTTFDAEYRPVDGGSTESEGHPDWSPDGASLAFEAERGGEVDVFTARLDGSGVRRRTRHPGMDSYPRYSPDGNRLAFLRRGTDGFTIHVIDLETGVTLPFVAGQGGLEPAFSPDGTRLAFRSYRGGADRDGEILIADLSSGHTLPMTANAVEDGYPSYAADGGHLFFHRRIGKHRQVMMLDLESGEEVQLTDGPFDSWHAHGSPDARSIVFDSERHGQRDVFLMDLDERAWTRVTTHPARDGYPKFSPDGRRVAFHSDRDGARAIFVVDLQTRELRRFEPVWKEAP